MGRISSSGAKSLPRLKQKKSAPVAKDDLLLELEDDKDPLKYVTIPMQGKDQPMFSNFNKYHKKLGSSPLILWFLGGLSLLLWACATTVQIQTSEYLVLGGDKKVAGVAWGILQYC